MQPGFLELPTAFAFHLKLRIFKVLSMSSSPFRYQHRVIYSECTAGNHIYYARYLDLLEAARGAFLRERGTSFRQWQDAGVIFPVIECHLRYRAPARYDDVLAVEVQISALDRVRLNFAYRITNHSGAVVMEGETHHVCTGLNEKPTRVPEELKKVLLPFARG
jgi:acyl-CoA thioester hydrolase